MTFKKPKLMGYSVRLTKNGYYIRANHEVSGNWTIKEYVAGSFDELVAVLTLLEVESGK